MIKTNKLFKQVSSMILLILFGLSNVFLQPQVKAVDLTNYEVVALIDENESQNHRNINNILFGLDTDRYNLNKVKINIQINQFFHDEKPKHTAVQPTLYIICDPNFEVPEVGTNSCLYLLTPETRNSKNVKKLPRNRVFNTIYNLEDDLNQPSDETSTKKHPEKLQQILETALRFEIDKDVGWTLQDEEKKHLTPLPWHSTPSGKLGLGLTGTCLLALGTALVYKTYNYVKTNNNKKLQN